MVDSTLPRDVSILLVDDNPANLVALRAILEPLRCRLVAVTSGQAALARVAAEEFAVVLLDVRMPGLDGFEVATRLKADPATRFLPIVFVTAQATDVEHAARAYSCGAVDYLIKPLQPEIVRGKVETFVELQRQARALREAERREHELHLSELRAASDQRYRKLIEGIDHVIAWSADPSTLRLSFLSKQAVQVFGVGPAEVVDPGFWTRRLHPDDRERFLAAVARTITDRVDQSCNHRMLAADGRTLWFHTGLSMVLDTPVPELHGVSADVTDLKLAEEEAREATRAREELLAVVSHDLKTPLQAISMTVQRLSGITTLTADATGQAKAGIARIHRAATQMDRLLDDLLDMERIRRRRLHVELRPERAAALARDAVELIEGLAAERSIDLAAEVDDVADVDVLCDPDRIVQVLTNLLGNAIKSCGRGGSIRLRAARRGDEVQLAVADTGRGIAPADLARLFDAPRVTPARRDGGLGLGLAISKGIVEAHGGALEVESAVGRGTTFRFALPTV